MQKSKKLFAAALAVSALLGGVSVQAADLPNLKNQAVLQWVDEEGDQKGHTVIHTGTDDGKGNYTNNGTIQLQASSVQIGVGDDAASFNAADVNNFRTFYQNFSDINAEELKNNADLLAKYKAAGIVPGTIEAKPGDTAENSIAIGEKSKVTGNNSIAIGGQALSSADVVLGQDAVASGSSATAIGMNAHAQAQEATALGNNAYAQAKGSVALGAGSVANEANTVSVGKDGGERRIVNVAAGTKDTDAVNFKQLSDVDLVAQGASEKVGTADFARTNYAADATNATDAIYKVDTQVKTNTENIQANTDMIGTADFTKTNYAAKTQNVTDALYAVDGQVKANADKLVAVESEAEKHTTLTEKTGNLNVVKTDKDGQANYDVSLSNHVTLSKDNNKVDLNGDEGTISVKNNSGIGTVDFASATMDFNQDGLTIGQNYGVESAMLNANSTNIKGGTITAKGTLDKTVNVLGKDYGIYDRTEISGGDITSTKESYTIKTSWGGFNGIEKETHKFDVSDKGVTFTKEESRIGLNGLKPVNETTTSSTNIDGSHITAGTVKINGESGSTMTGLTNTKWDANGTYNAGRAATEEQLKGAYDDVSSKITETAATAKKHTTVKNGDNIELAEGTNADGGKEYTVSLAKDITVDSVTVNGEVKANSANLGGVEIGGGNINAATASIGNLGVAGNISASTATITNLGVENNIYAKLGTIGGVGFENGTVTAKTVNTLTGEIGGVKFTGYGRIQNVNDGVQDNDAVNMKQLKSVQTEAGKKTTVSAGDENVTVEKDGLDYKVGLADNLKVKDVVADSANIGGVNLVENQVKITAANGYTIMDQSGFYATQGEGYTKVSGEGIDTNGYVKAASGTIGGVELAEGNITAVSGKIGDFNIMGSQMTLSTDAGTSVIDQSGFFVGNADGATRVTATGITTNKVTGLTDGAVNADSTDAVNGSQLFKVKNSVENLSNSAVTYDDADKKSVTFAGEGGTALKNVNAIEGVGGGKLNFNQYGAGLYFGDYTISATNSGAGISVINSDLTTSSIMVSKDKGVVVSGGLDVTGSVISNVADGVKASDAVNKGQLDKVESQVSTLNQNAVKYDSKGELHAGKEQTGKLDLKNDGSASISSSNGNSVTVDQNGTTITGNANVTGDFNVEGKFSVNGKEIATQGDIKNLSGAIGEMDADGKVVLDNKGTSLTDGINKNANQIGLNEDGTYKEIKVTDTEGKTVTNLTDAVNANNDKIAATNKVIGGTGENGALKLDNGKTTVEAGINQNTADILQNRDAINSLGRSVNKLGGEIDSVGAISAALAGLHPIDYDPTQSKYQLSAALGSYDGSSALALGGFYNFNKDVLLSLGVSSALKGERKTAGNLGVTFRIGAGAEKKAVPEADKDILTRIAELAQKVSVLEQKNDKLEKENADQKKQIEVLQAKTF